MKRLVLLPLIFTTACLGGPAFTVGEAPDSGPLLAELAPDVAMAEDGGATGKPDADPPDALAAKGGTRDSADGGLDASTPEASTSEETSTPEAAQPDAEEAFTPEAAQPDAEETSTPEASTPEAAPPDAGCGILYCQAPQSTTDCSGLSASNTLSYSCAGTCAAGDLCTFHFAAYPGCTGTVLCAE
jgi:hypothetical protein